MRCSGVAFLCASLAASWTPAARAQDRGTPGGQNPQAAARWHGEHFEISLLNRGRPMRDWSFNRNPDDPVGPNEADLVITNNAQTQPYRIIVQSQAVDMTDARWLRGGFDPDNYAGQIENDLRGKANDWRSVRQVSKARASGSRFPIPREGGTELVLDCEPAAGGPHVMIRFYCFQSGRNQRIYTVYAQIPMPENPRDAEDPEIRGILGSFNAYRPR